jgi:hypothetical protein
MAQIMYAHVNKQIQKFKKEEVHCGLNNSFSPGLWGPTMLLISGSFIVCEYHT